MRGLRGGWREFRRAISWHRRLLAAALLAAACAFALSALAPAPAPTQVVLAAARDLPGGIRLSREDLGEVRLPPDAVPAGVLAPDEAIGRVLAGPVRPGEPLTDLRLIGPSLLSGYPGLVAAPVRVADADAVALLRPGDRVDIFAADTSVLEPGSSVSGGAARLLAENVPVIAVPAPSEEVTPGGEDALVVFAVNRRIAAELAGAAVAARVSVVLRPP